MEHQSLIFIVVVINIECIDIFCHKDFSHEFWFKIAAPGLKSLKPQSFILFLFQGL